MKKIMMAAVCAAMVAAAGMRAEANTVFLDISYGGYSWMNFGGERTFWDSGLYDTLNGVSLGLTWTEAKEVYGLQIAPLGCVAKTLGGDQIGLLNFADGGGLQVGVYNHAEADWRGVQIGLVNHIEGGWILPLVNCRF